MHTQANNRETPLLDPDFTISFGKDDPDDPRNFGSWHKVYITCQLSMLTFVAALGSSILSPGQSDVAEYTNISSEVAVLATSMYILGLPIRHSNAISIAHSCRLGGWPNVMGPNKRGLWPQMGDASSSLLLRLVQYRNGSKPERRQHLHHQVHWWHLWLCTNQQCQCSLKRHLRTERARNSSGIHDAVYHRRAICWTSHRLCSGFKFKAWVAL